MQKTINILICPLDWGLGHATRCVPIIRHLLNIRCRVYIAGSGRSLDFLKGEFPCCQFIKLPSYRFIYSRKALMALAMLLSSPMILWGIYKEHRLLKRIVLKNQIHGIISDNRFGLWSNEIPCVYISHQVKIKTKAMFGFFEPILYKIHRYFIKKYDLLWIPDVKTEPSLSGDLAHYPDKSIKHIYIGPLSRFAGLENPKDDLTEFDHADILAIISGPEPQRSIFESMILKQASTVQEKIILLRGIPAGDMKPESKGNLTVYPHMETARLMQMIKNAGVVLCRPGYSSIMDLAVLGKKVFFVPTPGQTEQEYLAAYLYDQGICNYAPQHTFRLNHVIEQASSFKGFEYYQFANSFEQAVENFIEYICTKE